MDPAFLEAADFFLNKEFVISLTIFEMIFL